MIGRFAWPHDSQAYEARKETTSELARMKVIACGTEPSNAMRMRRRDVFRAPKRTELPIICHGGFAEHDWTPADSWALCKSLGLASIGAIYSAFFFCEALRES